jgi:Predicted metal-dependent hydrolase of the TIM-barrel fold
MQQGIIDTHVHIWSFDKAEYEWLKNNTTILNRDYDIAELEPSRTEAGITGGVLVQAANNFEDTNWMLETAARTGWILGVVGWMPLMDPSFTATALKQYLGNSYFKGVRHLIHDEPDARWLLQPTVLQSLSILAEYNIPYDVVGIKADHLRTSLEVANKVPGLRMILDHANQPAAFPEWRELMKEAAQHKNFYVKISGMGAISDVEPYVAYILEQFGADRCCCGGDWPVSLLAGSYTQTWKRYITVLTKLLDEEHLNKVLYSNAMQFYNLG